MDEEVFKSINKPSDQQFSMKNGKTPEQNIAAAILNNGGTSLEDDWFVFFFNQCHEKNQVF